MKLISPDHSQTLSRSSTTETTDSICSSSSSPPPRFARPTIASTQKQRQTPSNILSFKRTNSPPITTFTRIHPSSLSSINEDHEQINPILEKTCFLPENSRRKNSNLPLRYKRDSYIRLYG